MGTQRRYSLDEIRAVTYKPRDAWWTVLLVDPLASRLLRLVAHRRAVTPNRLTMAAFVLGLGAAACFTQARWHWLVAGAVLFHLSFVLDCMDGKLARLTGGGSVFGSWLDYIFDRLRVLACTTALAGGQYVATGEVLYLALGGAIVFLDMFRYLNALQINRVKDDMRITLAKLHADAGDRAVPPSFVDEVLNEVPDDAAPAPATGGDGRPLLDVHRDFRARFANFTRMRNYLSRRRIRVHLVSGIEFQMAVFIVGPVSGAIVEVTVVAGALLLLFELGLIYKLWLSTRTFGHQVEALTAGPAGAHDGPLPDRPAPGRPGPAAQDPAGSPVTAPRT